MARIGENAFRQYRDGQDRLTAREYMAEREQIRLAINDTEDKVERVESIREEFSNTVNEVEAVKGDVVQTKQEIETRIGEFTQTIDQTAQELQSKASKTEVQEVSTQVTDIVTVNVKSFANPGDTDWTNAINRAIAYAQNYNSDLNNKPLLLFPYNPDNYKVSSTIRIPHGINVTMNSPIEYVNTDGKDILVIGSPETYAYTQQYDLQAIRKTASWAVESSGIVVYNSNQSNIKILQTTGNYYGCTFYGDSKGFAYNAVTLNLLRDNKVHLRLKGLNSGWVNENIFFNGRFMNTSFNRSESRNAVLMESTGRINANIFYKPSFEIGSYVDSGVDTTPIIINPGRDNRFYDCRCEGNGNILARLSGNSLNNTFSMTYTDRLDIVIADDGDLKMGNYIVPATIREQRRTVYDSGFLPKKSYISKLSATSEYKIGDFFTCTISSTVTKANFMPYLLASSIEMTDDYVNFKDSRCLGRFISSEKCKDFKVSAEFFGDTETALVYVIPYNGLGEQLNYSDGKGIQYVKADGVTNVNYFNGSYQLSAFDKNGRIFRVSNDVKSFAILFSRATGGNGTRLRSVKVEQILNTTNNINDYVESSYSPFDWMNGQILVEGIPKSGKWEKGQVLTERNPKVGGHLSYVCLTSGDFVNTTPTFGKVGLIEA